jgi:phosphatidylinositol-3,4,5-trisphosphate 3-phosphatase/dual-specificity protein phosphatase PTEN
MLIRLILEFCIDITIFLTKNPDAVAAIHCKAGKGRTGVMICCYLIFSGICKDTDEAIKYYGEMRTLNGKVIV